MKGLIDIKALILFFALFPGSDLFSQAEIEIEITPTTCDTCCDGAIRIVSAELCGSKRIDSNWMLGPKSMTGKEIQGLCNEVYTIYHKSDELLGSLSFYVDGDSTRTETHRYSCEHKSEPFFRSDLEITGFFKHHFERDTIGGEVQVFQDNELIGTYPVSPSGYEFKLPIAGEYELHYLKDGYFTKKLIIDTDGPKGFNSWRGYRLHIDMVMIPHLDGLSLPILDQPISKASYDSKEDDYTWNLTRAYKVKQAIDKKMAPYFEAQD